MLTEVAFWFAMAFLASEVILSRLRRSRTMARDRGSLRGLHWTIGISITLGVSLMFTGIGWYPFDLFWRSAISIGLLVVGAAMRWTAIRQLGKRFTVAVEIQHDHTLMRSGMYRFVRHPSYSGLMLEFLGLTVYFNNWITQLLILVPITISLFYRIRVEEQALLEQFGAEYEDYMKQTVRLIPGLW
ncbi:isoprenylcysteine carboxylmethyltransferase family protein [bacterium]|nr:isoprenylcysteine carboxylmethyltransferase family protein [bacterium]